ncbi:MAG TPA: aminopeptidase [Vitreimonas sp.]|nr:aminopeptidase [Vitreimonas sp.]
MSDSYVPSTDILRKYAEVMIKYALNGGKGVKKGEVVQLVVPDVAKALARELHNATLRAGAHPMLRILPTGFDKDFYDLASDDQLTFFPQKYMKARVDVLDHQVVVIADVDPEELKDVPSSKIIKGRDSKRKYREWLVEKETNGKFTWTIALWGVEAKAKEVGLSLEEYWQQIINACFLDKEDPVAEWKKVQSFQETILKKLNDMEIEWVHAVGPDMDIKFKLGSDRIWQGGSGRNIPSFEFFTSPDWRGTEGWIEFNQPVYRYGKILRDVRLEFKDGLVSYAKAKVGDDLLQEMLKSPNANKVGEYSLTDKRISRITHVMAETLFDENISGPYGNTHLAIGMAYKDCYRGDASTLSKQDWEERGFNDSAEHTDIVSTTDRTVTATLKDGSQAVIYKDGMFTLY